MCGVCDERTIYLVLEYPPGPFGPIGRRGRESGSHGINKDDLLDEVTAVAGRGVLGGHAPVTVLLGGLTDAGHNRTHVLNAESATSLRGGKSAASGEVVEDAAGLGSVAHVEPPMVTRYLGKVFFSTRVIEITDLL